MKKSNLGIAIIMFLLVFSSCTSNENQFPEEQSTKLLKSYKVKRDASGAYYLDLNLENNANVGKFQNNTTNTNEFHLSTSDKKSQQKASVNSDLLFSDGKLKVEFINDNQGNKRSLTIFDDDNNKVAQKSGDDNSLLKEFNIVMNEDGTYGVDFEVENGVEVNFVYNEEISAHEIHLEEGKGNENSFSRTLEKEEGELLNIHFVNHSNNSNAKIAESLIRKPVIVIDNGD